MRKRLVICLLLLLLVVQTAAAEDRRIQVEADYEGSWIVMPDRGFELFVPVGWVIGASEGSDGVVLMEPDTQRTMWIEFYPGEGFVLESIQADFEKADGIENVSVLYFGEVPFISYNVPSGDMFGAVTLSADHSTAFFFKFKPLSDADYSLLSLKIMSTLRPVTQ